MTENKKNIWFFSIVSFVFLVLTFSTSQFYPKCLWIKKDFLVAITSGIFASSCVVLFSEFVKYKLNKKNGQNALYGNLRELYRQILIHTKYASFLLDNPNKNVTENSFSTNVPVIKSICYAIKVLNYDIFFKNDFSNVLISFLMNEMPLFENYISACEIFLEKSILETKLEKQKQGIFNYSATSNDENVRKILEVIKTESEKWCKSIDKLICILDETCEHRFLWKDDKSVVDSFEFATENKSIYDFLNKQ